MPLCSQLFQCEEKSGGPVQTDVLHKESSHSHGLATAGVRLTGPSWPQHLASTQNCRIRSLLPTPCCGPGPYLHHWALGWLSALQPPFLRTTFSQTKLEQATPLLKAFPGLSMALREKSSPSSAYLSPFLPSSVASRLPRVIASLAPSAHPPPALPA